MSCAVEEFERRDGSSSLPAILGLAVAFARLGSSLGVVITGVELHTTMILSAVISVLFLCRTASQESQKCEALQKRDEYCEIV